MTHREFIIKYAKQHSEEECKDHVQVDFPEFINGEVRNIHKSRYIASWMNATGALAGFESWLEQLIIDGSGLSEDEISEITNFAENGKLELETNAKFFCKQNR